MQTQLTSWEILSWRRSFTTVSIVIKEEKSENVEDIGVLQEATQLRHHYV